MHDDVSAIPTTGCNVLSSATVLDNYYNGVRKRYIQIGGKWFFSSQTSYNIQPDSASCINLSELSSNSEMLPLYYLIAFILAFFVWFLWWFCFRRLFKWRIR